MGIGIDAQTVDGYEAGPAFLDRVIWAFGERDEVIGLFAEVGIFASFSQLVIAGDGGREIFGIDATGFGQLV